MLYDTHVHTVFSFDGKQTPAQAVEAAARVGFGVGCGITITEHFSVLPYDVSYEVFQFAPWNAAVEEAQLRGKALGVSVLRGLEVGEPHLLYEKLREQLAKFDELDVIIGSLHNIGPAKFRHFLQGKSHDEAYATYFSNMLEMVSGGDMDVVGHMDLLRRYAFDGVGDYIFLRWRAEIDEILHIMAQKDLALEINTSGLTQGSGRTYPIFEVVKRFHELGGELITIGSDAHKPEDVGYGLRQAADIALAAGFRYVCHFEKRQAVMEAIG